MQTCPYCGFKSDSDSLRCPRCHTFYSDQVRERVEAEEMANTPPPRSLKKILFSFDGRISQKTFCISYLSIYGSILLLWAIATWLWNPASILMIIVFLLSRVSDWALVIKRMKDFNRNPGILVFGTAVPILGQLLAVLFLVEGLIREGTVGKNRFGLDPLGRENITDFQPPTFPWLPPIK
jgi:uncharacterized membrane protein YhaH (DUF805 family)